MANTNKVSEDSKIVFASSYSRMNGQPIDDTLVWYSAYVDPTDANWKVVESTATGATLKTGLERAQHYATTATAYVGQVLTVITNSGTEEEPVFSSKVYVIENESGSLKEVNTAVEATQDTAGLMSATDKKKLDGIASGVGVNVIEKIKVNSVEQTVTDKTVNITVPTKVSELTNDSGYITLAEVPEVVLPTVDQNYDAESANAQSGKAVAEAIDELHTDIQEEIIPLTDEAIDNLWATTPGTSETPTFSMTEGYVPVWNGTTFEDGITLDGIKKLYRHNITAIATNDEFDETDYLHRITVKYSVISSRPTKVTSVYDIYIPTVQIICFYGDGSYAGFGAYDFYDGTLVAVFLNYDDNVSYPIHAGGYGFEIEDDTVTEL